MAKNKRVKICVCDGHEPLCCLEEIGRFVVYGGDEALDCGIEGVGEGEEGDVGFEDEHGLVSVEVIGIEVELC